MIIEGKQLIKSITNRSASYDGFFPRSSIWKPVKTGWVDTEGEDTYAISFKESDHIQINNNLLKSKGWHKEKDSDNYLSIVDSYIAKGYIIDYVLKKFDTHEYSEYYPRVISPTGEELASPNVVNRQFFSNSDNMYRYIIDLVKVYEEVHYEH